MDWSIQEVAKMAGTTSRTLRHYDMVGLLAPSGTGGNGYRRYDAASLVRLQRILLLRDLGLGLSRIGEVLAEEADAAVALDGHLLSLRTEQERLVRQIAAVERTIQALREGGSLMVENMFDGFDHTRYEREVEERWGADAAATSTAWWRDLAPDAKTAWQADAAGLAREWIALAERGVAADSDEAQALAGRHVEWLRGVPGTPAAKGGGEVGSYVRGLADLYVADERFARTYATGEGGDAGARFVRDALVTYADRRL